jgi:hypothetical protein
VMTIVQLVMTIVELVKGIKKLNYGHWSACEGH